jgi:serine/threonine protein kinase
MKISTGVVEDITVDTYSDDLKKLIKQILTKDPEGRPSANEILNNPTLSCKTE